MLRSVSTGISLFRGTIAVSSVAPDDRANMAALLPHFPKTSGFEPALDFAVGQRLKPPRPRPRRHAPSVGALLAAVRSEVQGLLLVRFSSASSSVAPDWQRRFPDTVRCASYSHARRSRRTVASCHYGSTHPADTGFIKFRVVLDYDPVTQRYSAVCPELPGCASAGETEAEARQTIAEAIRLYVAE